jgi:hypothetical protein
MQSAMFLPGLLLFLAGTKFEGLQCLLPQALDPRSRTSHLRATDIPLFYLNFEVILNIIIFFSILGFEFRLHTF